MSTSKVLLILGAGGNTGASVASSFAQQGYKVALVARRAQDGMKEDGTLNIQADLASAESLDSAFDKVSATFGPPSVIVYNAASVSPVSPENPLDYSVESFNRDITVNTGSVLVAARKSLQGFDKIAPEVPKSFIYTGNFLNQDVMLPLFSLGLGKSATAHLIAAASQAYAPKNYRFYYADQRKATGAPALRDLSGSFTAKHYLDLAEAKDERPWLQTFVGGEGYKDFSKSAGK